MASNQLGTPRVGSDIGDSSTSLQTIWLAACIVMLVVPSISMLLRFYIKLRLLKVFRLADVCCLLAWFFTIAQLGVAFALLDYVVGLHIWEIDAATYAMFAYLLNIQQIVYMPGIFLVKVSILLQFSDIFVTRTRNSRWWILWTAIIANAIFFLAMMFLEIFGCTPREKAWNTSVPGRCIDLCLPVVGMGALNVLDDLGMLILPLVWISQLKIKSKRRQVGLASIFAVGIIACVCSVIRLSESIIALENPDITYSLFPASLWALAELSNGLIVCCLPLLPRLFHTTVTSSRQSGSNSYEQVKSWSSQSKNHSVSAKIKSLDRPGGNTADLRLGVQTDVHGPANHSRFGGLDFGRSTIPDSQRSGRADGLAGPGLYGNNPTSTIATPPTIHREVDIRQTLEPA